MLGHIAKPSNPLDYFSGSNPVRYSRKLAGERDPYRPPKSLSLRDSWILREFPYLRKYPRKIEPGIWDTNPRQHAHYASTSEVPAGVEIHLDRPVSFFHGVTVILEICDDPIRFDVRRTTAHHINQTVTQFLQNQRSRYGLRYGNLNRVASQRVLSAPLDQDFAQRATPLVSHTRTAASAAL